jgi:TRAP-type mannitol/chloroaromatic compound transport system permease small subunit
MLIRAGRQDHVEIPGVTVEKQRRIELMGLLLFLIGMCGILLFFFMAFTLFTDFSATGSITGTDSTQLTTDFYAYLLHLTMPIVILLVVGGVSILVAQYGISTYSIEERKNP